MISTYTDLCTQVADHLNRADLDTVIPTFVQLAEAQFNRELRTRDMMVRADATSDAENVELPDDWLEHYSLTLAPNGTLDNALRYMSERESNELKALGMTGPVIGYTVIGNSIELVPAPADNVDLRMVYFARIPSLSSLVLINWLLTKSPDLYLYSTLLQAEPYLKNDERLPLWAQLRTALMESIRMESEASLRPRSGLVARVRAF
jgi:hypothetical protein